MGETALPEATIRGPRRTGSSGTWKVILGVTLVAAALILGRYFNVQAILRNTLEWIAQLGAVGLLMFAGLYILATILFLPGLILTLGAGALFGLVQGTLVVSISATLGATCAFLLGRHLARRWVERRIRDYPRFQVIDEAVSREGWKIVGLTRLSPVFPFNLLNYAYGITKVSLRDYFFASWIGMIPGTVMYVYIGSVAGDLATLESGQGSTTPVEWILRIVGLLATVAVALYVARVARKALAERIL